MGFVFLGFVFLGVFSFSNDDFLFERAKEKKERAEKKRRGEQRVFLFQKKRKRPLKNSALFLFLFLLFLLEKFFGGFFFENLSMDLDAWDSSLFSGFQLFEKEKKNLYKEIFIYFSFCF